MKFPVRLVSPGFVNVIAVICYCLAIVFHIIAYATNGWSSLVLDGVRWDMGLWQGCTDINGTSICTADVFQHSEFQTGSEWHLGSRIMMTLSLILLFILEIPLLGYAFIERLQKYRAKLFGYIIVLSAGSAFSHFLVLIMYGSEVGMLGGDSVVKGTIALVVFSMILELAIPIIVYIDKEKRFPCIDHLVPSVFKRNDEANTPNNTSSSAKRKRLGENGRTCSVLTVNGLPSRTTSVSSLSETETYRKFARYDEFTNPSTVSEGSLASFNGRLGAYRNAAYDLTDRDSIESGV